MQSILRPHAHVLLLASVILAALFVVPSSIHPVHAAGVLAINPSQQGPFSVNTLVTYQVNVTGMDSFDSWDVSVKTDA
jgi:hypothetical protein